MIADTIISIENDVTEPEPPVDVVPLDDVEFPEVERGGGFDYSIADGISPTITVVIAVAVAVVLLAGVVFAAHRLSATKPLISKSVLAFGTLLALLIPGAAALILTTNGPAGYGEFKEWAKDRYSINIQEPGYAPLLEGEPTYVEHKGQLLYVELVKSDDGLGYLTAEEYTHHELVVHPDSFGQSMDVPAETPPAE